MNINPKPLFWYDLMDKLTGIRFDGLKYSKKDE
jgi:hypothetical protein